MLERAAGGGVVEELVEPGGVARVARTGHGPCGRTDRSARRAQLVGLLEADERVERFEMGVDETEQPPVDDGIDGHPAAVHRGLLTEAVGDDELGRMEMKSYTTVVAGAGSFNGPLYQIAASWSPSRTGSASATSRASALAAGGSRSVLWTTEKMCALEASRPATALASV